MNKRFAYPKVISLLSGVAFLCALACMMLPVLEARTATGEAVPFFGWITTFGGTVVRETEGGVYSFAFSLSVPMILILQGMLLSAVACYLSPNSLINRIFATVLSTATFVLLFFAKKFILDASSLPENGMEYGVGWMIAFGFCLMGLLLEYVSLFLGGKKKRG